MTALDWLRAKARARNPMAGDRRPRDKPAIGGIIIVEQAPIISEGGCDYTVPRSSFDADGRFTPVTSVELEVTYDLREPAPADVEHMARQLGVNVAGKPAAESEPDRVEPSIERTRELTAQAQAAADEKIAAINCPCVIIYSHCYYPAAHASRRR